MTRSWLMATVLVTGLGCSGLGQRLMDATGSEFHVGAAARQPADFPLPPPEGGILVASGRLTIGGTETTTVQYDLPAGSDPLPTYEAVMRDAGLSPERGTEIAGTTSVNATHADGRVWSATVANQVGKQQLTLLVARTGGS